MKFQGHFALSHVVAMRLNLPSKHCRAMSTPRQKPIDFAAEGLCLASLSIPTAESGFKVAICIRTLAAFSWILTPTVVLT